MSEIKKWIVLLMLWRITLGHNAFRAMERNGYGRFYGCCWPSLHRSKPVLGGNFGDDGRGNRFNFRKVSKGIRERKEVIL